MPELPEVETIARGLAAAVTGREIARATMRARDLYRCGSARVETLRGARIAGVERLGKAIRISVERPGRHDDRSLIVHLGMTGSFRFSAPGHVEKTVPRHRHGRFLFNDGSELWYVDPRRFGFFYIGVNDGLRQRLNIGPDPFEIRPRQLAARLHGRRAPIKAILLDQRVISGLGNIYVDELLFAAEMHPLLPAGEAAGDAAALLRVTRRVLRRAIRFRGTTLRDYKRLDGSSGEYRQRLSVYGREGEPCLRCEKRVRRTVIAGRSSHFCPACQSR